MTDSSRLRKNLRDHDRAVTTALESVSSLVNDAYQHPVNGRPDLDVLTVAQIGAAQAIALSIRSLTAHTIVELDNIDDARDDDAAPAPITIKHFAPYGAYAAIDGTPIPQPTAWDEQAGEYVADEPFTSYRARVTCPTCLHQLLERAETRLRNWQRTEDHTPTDDGARRTTEETD